MSERGSETEAERVWLRLREVFGRPRSRRERPKPKGDNLPYGKGRDPLAAGTVLDAVTESLGWVTPLAQTDLTAAWRSIAGEETARHASVEGFADGVLLVRCDSTAWATQLGLMRAQIAERISRDFPAAGVESIRFLGPNTPSWNHGRRSVQGRGPRDTYG
jgi:predicted nucleic acid-binding Zn ribbon protein